MSDQKLTLDDILSGDEKLIKLELWEFDIDAVMKFLGGMDSMIRIIFPDKEDRYRFMRAVCIINLSLHKQGNACEVGSSDCNLLGFLQAFKERYGEELKNDKQYRPSDFEWK